MRVRGFFLIVALVTVLLSGGAARADLNYRAEITGVEDSDLASLVDKVSELKTLEDKPPVSEEALRRRADRDLGRLADAAQQQQFPARFQLVPSASSPCRTLGLVASCLRGRQNWLFIRGIPDQLWLTAADDGKKLQFQMNVFWLKAARIVPKGEPRRDT